MINKGEHFFEGTSDKEQELLTYVNDRIAGPWRLRPTAFCRHICLY